MKVDLTNDEAFAAAVERGVEKALQSPALLDGLAARIMPALFWLKYEEARRVVGVSESKFDRWIKTHREPDAQGCPALVISTAMGSTEPRVRLDSLQAVMNFHAPAAQSLLNGAQLLSSR